MSIVTYNLHLSFVFSGECGGCILVLDHTKNIRHSSFPGERGLWFEVLRERSYRWRERSF
jgi:hypothetical protein